MTVKKKYTCRHCQRNDLEGYQRWRRHENSCPMNPGRVDEEKTPPPANQPQQNGNDAGINPGTGPAANEPVKTDIPVFSNDVTSGPEQPGDEPDPIRTMIADEVSTRFAVFEMRFGELETSMGKKLQNSVDAINSNLSKVNETIVGTIEKSVNDYMQAQLGAVPPGVPPAPAPAPGGNGHGPAMTAEVVPPGPAAAQVAGGALGQIGNIFTAILSQLDLAQIVANIIAKQGGGDINAGIAALITKQLNPKAALIPVDAKYNSRGMSHFMSAIRNKKVDSDATALSLISMAENMLKEPGVLTPEGKGYYLGIKSAGDAYMRGKEIEREIISQKYPAAQPGPVAPGGTG